MSNYEPRSCVACGAPMKAKATECSYCGTGYEYIGPPVPEQVTNPYSLNGWQYGNTIGTQYQQWLATSIVFVNDNTSGPAVGYVGAHGY